MGEEQVEGEGGNFGKTKRRPEVVCGVLERGGALRTGRDLPRIAWAPWRPGGVTADNRSWGRRGDSFHFSKCRGLC